MGYYVKVEPDVSIYVEDINPGGSRTILFVHGWPLNHKMFEYQYNVLSGRGYRCIGIDTRGFGKSDKPWSGYTMDRIADDIRGIVEALRLHHFVLAGHSYGGAVSIRYMARHQGYGVCKLALFGAAAPSVTQRPGFPYGHPPEVVTGLIEQTYRNRPEMLRGIQELFLYRHAYEPFVEWFFHLGLEASGHATAKVAQSFRDETTFADLGQIRVPTLILHGKEDKVCLPPLALAQKAGIPHAKLVWLDATGHSLNIEQKDAFNAELIRFVEEDAD